MMRTEEMLDVRFSPRRGEYRRRRGGGQLDLDAGHRRSMMRALAMPPPSHIVCNP
jgi:hypothetical protein